MKWTAEERGAQRAAGSEANVAGVRDELELLKRASEVTRPTVSARDTTGHIVFPSDADTGDDIGSTSTPSDDGGTSVNHGVRNGASLVVAGIARTEGLSAKGLTEFLQGGSSQQQ